MKLKQLLEEVGVRLPEAWVKEEHPLFWNGYAKAIKDIGNKKVKVADADKIFDDIFDCILADYTDGWVNIIQEKAKALTDKYVLIKKEK